MGNKLSLADNAIHVYPNPAVSTINVTINTGTADGTKPSPDYRITITDSRGSLVRAVTSAQATWQNSVNNLLPGTYIVQVVNNTDKNLVGKTKFIKL